MCSTNRIFNCQVGSGPVLSSLKGHRLLSDASELRSRRKVVIVEIRKKGILFTSNVASILKIVRDELGSSPDYVRENRICRQQLQLKFTPEEESTHFLSHLLLL